MARRKGRGCQSLGDDGPRGPRAARPAVGGTLHRRAGPYRPAAGAEGRSQVGRARAAAPAEGAWARCPGAWCNRQRPAASRLMRAPDPAVVTIKVPFAVRKHGGRKLVLAPDGAPVPPLVSQVDGTLVKAIARTFRWQKMLET